MEVDADLEKATLGLKRKGTLKVAKINEKECNDAVGRVTGKRRDRERREGGVAQQPSPALQLIIPLQTIENKKRTSL